MDQSKWSLPRHRLIATSKEPQKYVRPRCKLHCVWIHNVALDLYLVGNGVSADASLILETLSLSLEGMAKHFEEMSAQMPSSCWLWAT